jgi:hypothetical protein
MLFDHVPVSERSCVTLRDSVLGDVPVADDDEEHPEDLVLRGAEELFELAIPTLPDHHRRYNAPGPPFTYMRPSVSFGEAWQT